MAKKSLAQLAAEEAERTRLNSDELNPVAASRNAEYFRNTGKAGTRIMSLPEYEREVELEEQKLDDLRHAVFKEKQIADRTLDFTGIKNGASSSSIVSGSSNKAKNKAKKDAALNGGVNSGSKLRKSTDAGFTPANKELVKLVNSESGKANIKAQEMSDKKKTLHAKAYESAYSPEGGGGIATTPMNPNSSTAPSVLENTAAGAIKGTEALNPERFYHGVRAGINYSLAEAADEKLRGETDPYSSANMFYGMTDEELEQYIAEHKEKGDEAIEKFKNVKSWIPALRSGGTLDSYANAINAGRGKDEGVSKWIGDLAYSGGRMLPTMAISAGVGAAAGAAANALAGSSAVFGYMNNAALTSGILKAAELTQTAVSTASIYAGVYDENLKGYLDSGIDPQIATRKAADEAFVEAFTESIVGGMPGMGKGWADGAIEGIGKKLAASAAAQPFINSGNAKLCAAWATAASKVFEPAGKLILSGVEDAAGVVANPVMKLILEANGEGFEEVVSEILAPYVNRAVIGANYTQDVNINDLLINPEFADTFNTDPATIGDLALAYAGGALLSIVSSGIAMLTKTSTNAVNETIRDNRAQRILDSQANSTTAESESQIGGNKVEVVVDEATGQVTDVKLTPVDNLTTSDKRKNLLARVTLTNKMITEGITATLAKEVIGLDLSNIPEYESINLIPQLVSQRISAFRVDATTTEAEFDAYLANEVQPVVEAAFADIATYSSGKNFEAKYLAASPGDHIDTVSSNTISLAGVNWYLTEKGEPVTTEQGQVRFTSVDKVDPGIIAEAVSAINTKAQSLPKNERAKFISGKINGIAAMAQDIADGNASAYSPEMLQLYKNYLVYTEKKLGAKSVPYIDSEGNYRFWTPQQIAADHFNVALEDVTPEMTTSVMSTIIVPMESQNTARIDELVGEINKQTSQFGVIVSVNDSIRIGDTQRFSTGDGTIVNVTINPRDIGSVYVAAIILSHELSHAAQFKSKANQFETEIVEVTKSLGVSYEDTLATIKRMPNYQSKSPEQQKAETDVRLISTLITDPMCLINAADSNQGFIEGIADFITNVTEGEPDNEFVTNLKALRSDIYSALAGTLGKKVGVEASTKGEATPVQKAINSNPTLSAVKKAADEANGKVDETPAPKLDKIIKENPVSEQEVAESIGRNADKPNVTYKGLEGLKADYNPETSCVKVFGEFTPEQATQLKGLGFKRGKAKASKSKPAYEYYYLNKTAKVTPEQTADMYKVLTGEAAFSVEEAHEAETTVPPAKPEPKVDTENESFEEATVSDEPIPPKEETKESKEGEDASKQFTVKAKHKDTGTEVKFVAYYPNKKHAGELRAGVQLPDASEELWNKLNALGIDFKRATNPDRKGRRAVTLSETRKNKGTVDFIIKAFEALTGEKVSMDDINKFFAGRNEDIFTEKKASQEKKTESKSPIPENEKSKEDGSDGKTQVAEFKNSTLKGLKVQFEIFTPSSEPNRKTGRVSKHAGETRASLKVIGTPSEKQAAVLESLFAKAPNADGFKHEVYTKNEGEENETTGSSWTYSLTKKRTLPLMVARFKEATGVDLAPEMLAALGIDNAAGEVFTGKNQKPFASKDYSSDNSKTRVVPAVLPGWEGILAECNFWTTTSDSAKYPEGARITLRNADGTKLTTAQKAVIRALCKKREDATTVQTDNAEEAANATSRGKHNSYVFKEDAGHPHKDKKTGKVTNVPKGATMSMYLNRWGDEVGKVRGTIIWHAITGEDTLPFSDYTFAEAAEEYIRLRKLAEDGKASMRHMRELHGDDAEMTDEMSAAMSQADIGLDVDDDFGAGLLDFARGFNEAEFAIQTIENFLAEEAAMGEDVADMESAVKEAVESGEGVTLEDLVKIVQSRERNDIINSMDWVEVVGVYNGENAQGRYYAYRNPKNWDEILILDKATNEVGRVPIPDGVNSDEEWSALTTYLKDEAPERLPIKKRTTSQEREMNADYEERLNKLMSDMGFSDDYVPEPVEVSGKVDLGGDFEGCYMRWNFDKEGVEVYGVRGNEKAKNILKKWGFRAGFPKKGVPKEQLAAEFSQGDFHNFINFGSYRYYQREGADGEVTQNAYDKWTELGGPGFNTAFFNTRYTRTSAQEREEQLGKLVQELEESRADSISSQNVVYFPEAIYELEGEDAKGRRTISRIPVFKDTVAVRTRAHSQTGGWTEMVYVKKIHESVKFSDYEMAILSQLYFRRQLIFDSYDFPNGRMLWACASYPGLWSYLAAGGQNVYSGTGVDTGAPRGKRYPAVFVGDVNYFDAVYVSEKPVEVDGQLVPRGYISLLDSGKHIFKDFVVLTEGSHISRISEDNPRFKTYAETPTKVTTKKTKKSKITSRWQIKDEYKNVAGLTSEYTLLIDAVLNRPDLFGAGWRYESPSKKYDGGTRRGRGLYNDYSPSLLRKIGCHDAAELTQEELELNNLAVQRMYAEDEFAQKWHDVDTKSLIRNLAHPEAVGDVLRIDISDDRDLDELADEIDGRFIFKAVPDVGVIRIFDTETGVETRSYDYFVPLLSALSGRDLSSSTIAQETEDFYSDFKARATVGTDTVYVDGNGVPHYVPGMSAAEVKASFDRFGNYGLDPVEAEKRARAISAAYFAAEEMGKLSKLEMRRAKEYQKRTGKRIKAKKRAMSLRDVLNSYDTPDARRVFAVELLEYFHEKLKAEGKNKTRIGNLTLANTNPATNAFAKALVQGLIMVHYPGLGGGSHGGWAAYNTHLLSELIDETGAERDENNPDKSLINDLTSHGDIPDAACIVTKWIINYNGADDVSVTPVIEDVMTRTIDETGAVTFERTGMALTRPEFFTSERDIDYWNMLQLEASKKSAEEKAKANEAIEKLGARVHLKGGGSLTYEALKEAGLVADESEESEAANPGEDETLADILDQEAKRLAESEWFKNRSKSGAGRTYTLTAEELAEWKRTSKHYAQQADDIFTPKGQGSEEQIKPKKNRAVITIDYPYDDYVIPPKRPTPAPVNEKTRKGPEWVAQHNAEYDASHRGARIVTDEDIEAAKKLYAEYKNRGESTPTNAEPMSTPLTALANALYYDKVDSELNNYNGDALSASLARNQDGTLTRYYITNGSGTGGRINRQSGAYGTGYYLHTDKSSVPESDVAVVANATRILNFNTKLDARDVRTIVMTMRYDGTYVAPDTMQDPDAIELTKFMNLCYSGRITGNTGVSVIDFITQLSRGRGAVAKTVRSLGYDAIREANGDLFVYSDSQLRYAKQDAKTTTRPMTSEERREWDTVNATDSGNAEEIRRLFKKLKTLDPESAEYLAVRDSIQKAEKQTRKPRTRDQKREQIRFTWNPPNEKYVSPEMEMYNYWAERNPEAAKARSEGRYSAHYEPTYSVTTIKSDASKDAVRDMLINSRGPFTDEATGISFRTAWHTPEDINPDDRGISGIFATRLADGSIDYGDAVYDAAGRELVLIPTNANTAYAADVLRNDRRYTGYTITDAFDVTPQKNWKSEFASTPNSKKPMTALEYLGIPVQSEQFDVLTYEDFANMADNTYSFLTDVNAIGSAFSKRDQFAQEFKAQGAKHGTYKSKTFGDADAGYETSVPKRVSNEKGTKVSKTAASMYRKVQDIEAEYASEPGMSVVMREEILRGVLNSMVIPDRQALEEVDNRLRKYVTAGTDIIDPYRAFADIERKAEKNSAGMVTDPIDELILGRLLIELSAKGSQAATPEYILGNKITTLIANTESNAARLLRAMQIFKAMSPRGRVEIVNGKVDILKEEINALLKQKGKFTGRAQAIARKFIENYTLPEDLVAAYKAAKTPQEMFDAEEALKNDIANNMPQTIEGQIIGWRYLCMLGTIKTPLKNGIGDRTMQAMVLTKNLIGAILEDKLAGKLGKDKDGYEGYRTKSLQNRVSVKEINQAIKDGKSDNKYIQFAMEQYEISQRALRGINKYGTSTDDIMRRVKTFNETGDKRLLDIIAHGLNAWNDFSHDLMEENKFFGDQPIMKFHYINTMANVLAANGWSTAYLSSTQSRQGQIDLNWAREYATTQALEATFRDAREFTKFIKKAEENAKLKNLAKLFIEGQLPFKTTPVNVGRRALEYSPAGIITRTLRAFKKVGTEVGVADGKHTFTAAEALDELSMGLTGLGALGVGAVMGLFGLLQIEGGPDDDNKREQYEQMLGYQDFSIVIGSINFTIDYFTPLSLVLFSGVELGEILANGGLSEQDISIGDVLTYLTTLAANLTTLAAKTLDPITQLSFLSSVDDALTDMKYDDSANVISSMATSALGNFATQFVPTAVGQAARIINNTRRAPYSVGADGTDWDVFTNKLKTKTGIGVNSVEPYVDLWGRTQGNSGAFGTDVFFDRVAGQALVPWYAKKINKTKVDNELLRLSEVADTSTVFPTKPDKTVKFKDGDYSFTPSEYTEVQKVAGDMKLKVSDEALSSSYYNLLTDSGKAETMHSINLFGNYGAYGDFADSHTDFTYESMRSLLDDVDAAERAGLSRGDYFVIKQLLSENNATKKNDKIRLLSALGLTITQRGVFTD